MEKLKLAGLIAATYTPFDSNGDFDVTQIESMTRHLRRQKVDGLYVCGSTGEGVSMTGAERRAVAAAYVSAAAGDIPVVVQVGHNSLFEARELAAHAQEIGADAVSANAPSYFKITDVMTLVDSMSVVAAGAPELPFYYYHIPHLTGANISMLDFLEVAQDKIPNLTGIKYTATTIHEYQACLTYQHGRHEVLWGTDEMLLAALAVGAKGAVGSTYNLIAPLFRTAMNSFASGDLTKTRRCQALANEWIRVIYQWPFHPAMREVLRMVGVECGECRLPHPKLPPGAIENLREQLNGIRFFDWYATGEPPE